MKTWQILLGLFTIILVYQVGSEGSENVLEIRVPPFVPFEKNFTLNCSTPDPENTIIESRLKKYPHENGTNWITNYIFMDDWEESRLHCMYDNEDVNTTVMAYALPSSVTIDMETMLEEGKEYTITCTVHEVSPLEFLTIYIKRGEDIINSKSYGGPHVVDRQTVSHLYNFTASRSDHLKNFSCEAVLQLDLDRYSQNSSEMTVQTYTLPDTPVIKVQKWIENGTSYTAECLVANVFPPEDVTMQMFIEDNPLDVSPNVTNEGSVMGIVGLNAEYSKLGLKTIRCEVVLFTLFMVSMENINIYELPTMSFALSSNITNLGENVTATCNITNKNPGGYGLFISVDGKEEQRNLATTLTYTFTARRRTPILNVTCTAYIFDNSGISRSSTETLQLHYPPEFTENLCLSTLVLVERKTRFLCHADGNPKPTVECHADGHYINDMVTVTRNMTGNYTCETTNERGDATKHVNVIVQYPPTTPTLTASPSATIRIGKPLNLTCKTDGLPTPMYSWKIPKDASVTFSEDKSSLFIQAAAMIHNGTYTCVANNSHGKTSAKQKVMVEPVPVDIAPIVFVVAFVVLSVVVAAICWYYLWKKDKKGSYEVERLKQSQRLQNGYNQSENPLVDQSSV